MRVRDAVRERDAPTINEAVLTIISEGADKMRALRKGEVQPTIKREEEVSEEVVDWGVRAFGSYIRKLLRPRTMFFKLTPSQIGSTSISL